MQKKREWLDKHGRVRMPEPSKALAELREEMKQAKMNNLEKVNAGKFSFLKMALELEEGKFQTATREARERNYEFERKAKNVRNGEMDGTDSEDESDDEAGGNGRRKHRMREADANDPDFRRDLDPPIVKRGSDADLLDPDYRRDAMPSAPAPPPPAAALTQNKKKPQKKPQQNKKLPPKQQQQQQQQKQQHQKQNSNAAIKAIPKPKFENLSLNG
jgi:glucan-binding YG repeat protein